MSIHLGGTRVAQWIFCTVLLAGCAGVDVTVIADANADAAANGLRYYDTSPFLLLYTDAKGGLRSELLYLPDTTKKRAITPYHYAASNDTVLTFDQGRLVQAKTAINETVLPAAVVKSLENLAAARLAAGVERTIPAPSLFRIVKQGGNWTLAGQQALDLHGRPAFIRYLPQQGDTP